MKILENNWDETVQYYEDNPSSGENKWGEPVQDYEDNPLSGENSDGVSSEYFYGDEMHQESTNEHWKNQHLNLDDESSVNMKEKTINLELQNNNDNSFNQNVQKHLSSFSSVKKIEENPDNRKYLNQDNNNGQNHRNGKQNKYNSHRNIENDRNSNKYIVNNSDFGTRDHINNKELKTTNKNINIRSPTSYHVQTFQSTGPANSYEHPSLKSLPSHTRNVDTPPSLMEDTKSYVEFTEFDALNINKTQYHPSNIQRNIHEVAGQINNKRWKNNPLEMIGKTDKYPTTLAFQDGKLNSHSRLSVELNAQPQNDFNTSDDEKNIFNFDSSSVLNDWGLEKKYTSLATPPSVASGNYRDVYSSATALQNMRYRGSTTTLQDDQTPNLFALRHTPKSAAPITYIKYTTKPAVNGTKNSLFNRSNIRTRYEFNPFFRNFGPFPDFKINAKPHKIESSESRDTLVFVTPNPNHDSTFENVENISRTSMAAMPITYLLGTYFTQSVVNNATYASDANTTAPDGSVQIPNSKDTNLSSPVESGRHEPQMEINLSHTIKSPANELNDHGMNPTPKIDYVHNEGTQSEVLNGAKTFDEFGNDHVNFQDATDGDYEVEDRLEFNDGQSSESSTLTDEDEKGQKSAGFFNALLTMIREAGTRNDTLRELLPPVRYVRNSTESVNSL